jgi:hypothetical protein
VIESSNKKENKTDNSRIVNSRIVSSKEKTVDK